jgi:hypothetical protein
MMKTTKAFVKYDDLMTDAINCNFLHILKEHFVAHHIIINHSRKGHIIYIMIVWILSSVSLKLQILDIIDIFPLKLFLFKNFQ